MGMAKQQSIEFNNGHGLGISATEETLLKGTTTASQPEPRSIGQEWRRTRVSFR